MGLLDDLRAADEKFDEGWQHASQAKDDVGEAFVAMKSAVGEADSDTWPSRLQDAYSHAQAAKEALETAQGHMTEAQNSIEFYIRDVQG